MTVLYDVIVMCSGGTYEINLPYLEIPFYFSGLFVVWMLTSVAQGFYLFTPDQ